MDKIEMANPGRSRKWVTDKHNETFAAWLNDDFDSNPYDPKNDGHGNGELVCTIATI
jgi:hypothetical protein